MFILRNTNGSDIYYILLKVEIAYFYPKDKGIKQTEVQILETQMVQIYRMTHQNAQNSCRIPEFTLNKEKRLFFQGCSNL